MRDQDHKVGRGIVNFAIQNNVSDIRPAQLVNIYATARTSHKNKKHLHTWSFYRFSQYIEYKAMMAGITVFYVDPKYTGRTCLICGKRNHARDRRYFCPCFYLGKLTGISQQIRLLPGKDSKTGGF
jgi:putative transposase